MITLTFTIKEQLDGIETELVANGKGSPEEFHFADHMCAIILDGLNDINGGQNEVLRQEVRAEVTALRKTKDSGNPIHAKGH